MNTPTSLYKYKSLSGDNKDHVIEMLEDHIVWFSKREDFNDPFEFHFTPSFEATTYEKIEVLARALQSKDPHLTNDSAKAEATSAFLSMSKYPDILKEREQKRLNLFYKRLNEEVGVFSLTEHNYDILMWSHYADKHRGICIELKPIKEEHDNFFYQVQKVIYPKKNNPPQLNFYKYRNKPEEWAIKCLTTKALHWEYEAEWRIIDVKNGPGKNSIPEGIISSIILGYRIEKNDRDLIIKLSSAYPTPITIYQAKIKSDYYELEIQRIDCIA